MYQRPELCPIFDALWLVTRDLLRERGIDAPEALTVVESDLPSFWRRPDLLLSQTCGYPFRHFLKGLVTLVGAPDFGLEGCAPGHYRSALVVRRDDPRRSLNDFRGATIVCNDLHSQSGYAAPMVAAQRAGLRFGAIRVSGAHVASARMVAGGDADVAGIDAVSWRHMRFFDSEAKDLRVLDWTEATPGLPFITALAPLAPTIRSCLVEATRRLEPAMRDLLTLKDIVRIDEASYMAVPEPSELT